MTSAICGSDFHLYEGYIATMEKDDVLGREFIGVEEAGPNHPLKRGSRSDSVPDLVWHLPFWSTNGNCSL